MILIEMHNYSNELYDNIKNEDVYEFQNQVTITDAINGNVYAMGKDVKLDKAIIYGNVFVMAENVEFADVEIYGSIYIIAQNVNFVGTTNDIYSISEKLNIGKEAYVWRDVKAVAESLTIDGEIARNLDYSSKEEASIAEDAKVGNVNFHKFEQSETKTVSITDYIKSAINVAVRTLVISLILVYVTKKNLKPNNLLKDTAKGLGVLILVPIIFVIFLISSIASELGLILIFLYITMLFLGTSFASLAIASKLTDENKKLVGYSVLIALAIWVIGLIPYVGSWVQFIAILLGLGAMLPNRNSTAEEAGAEK